jgi:hypothetical protein
MKTFCFTREELSILIYALIASKQHIDESKHSEVDSIIAILNS